MSAWELTHRRRWSGLFTIRERPQLIMLQRSKEASSAFSWPRVAWLYFASTWSFSKAKASLVLCFIDYVIKRCYIEFNRRSAGVEGAAHARETQLLDALSTLIFDIWIYPHTVLRSYTLLCTRGQPGSPTSNSEAPNTLASCGLHPCLLRFRLLLLGPD